MGANRPPLLGRTHGLLTTRSGPKPRVPSVRFYPLAARLDRFEAERQAAAVLDELEEKIEREPPPEITDGTPLP
jgi:hypothetical protein